MPDAQIRPVLFLVGLMTFAASIMAQFATQGVALFLRAEETSSGTIGLIYLAAIPYTLRFLWAPLVDRSGLGGQGRYARWLIVTQIACALAIAAMGLVDPASAPLAIIAILAVFMVSAGTQQTALGGLMTASVPAEHYPKVTSIQGISSGLAGFILGAAVLYVLADIGWQAVITALTTISLAGCLVAVWIAPPADVRRTRHDPRVPVLSHLSVFKEPQARQLFVISALINCSVGIPYGTKAVLFIDAGFSVSDGALYGIVLGNLFGVLGALFIRPVIDRLGGTVVLAGLGALNVVVVLPFAFLAMDGLGPLGTTALVLFASFSVFASFIASRSLIMRLCEPGRQATELASFVGLEAVVYLIIAGISLALLDRVGLATILFCLLPCSGAGSLLAWRYQTRYPGPHRSRGEG